MKLRMYGFLGFLGWVCFFANTAWATLGEKVDTVEADRAALSAVRARSSAKASYSIQTLKSDSNTVREYVSPSGTVFGVAWNGYMHPNLSQLLGAYATDFQTAASSSPRIRGQRSRTVSGAHVVVQTWGHMRSLQGRAYDPALIPQGVSADEIN